MNGAQRWIYQTHNVVYYAATLIQLPYAWP